MTRTARRRPVTNPVRRAGGADPRRPGRRPAERAADGPDLRPGRLAHDAETSPRRSRDRQGAAPAVGLGGRTRGHPARLPARAGAWPRVPTIQISPPRSTPPATRRLPIRSTCHESDDVHRRCESSSTRGMTGPGSWPRATAGSRDRFAFERRDLGQPVSVSEVEAVARAGVLAVDSTPTGSGHREGPPVRARSSGARGRRGRRASDARRSC